MYFEEISDSIRSALSLIKNNDGLFRSAKQSNFLTKKFADLSYLDPKCAGIEEEGSFTSWTGYIRWSEFGGRSIRQFGWVFKYDEFGIVKAWKLKWKEVSGYDSNMNYRPTGQMVLDPAKIKPIFERPESVDLSALKAEFAAKEEAEVEEGAVSEFVGVEGEKFEADVEVTHTFVSTAGYYGPSLLIGMQDEAGNKLVWFSSSMPDVNKGDKFRIKGRVKKHNLYKGAKQTALTRCKISNLKEAA